MRVCACSEWDVSKQYNHTVILMNERVPNAHERRGLSVNNTIIFLMNEIERICGVGWSVEIFFDRTEQGN